MTAVTDEQGSPRRVFFTTATSGYPAKDRSGKLAAVENPDLAEIKAKILGE
jgi:hypothetical protein